MRTFATRLRARLVGARRFIGAAASLAVGVLGATQAQAAINASMTVAPPSSSYANPIFQGDVTAVRVSLTNDDAAHVVDSTSFTLNLGAGLKAVRVAPGTYVCTAGSGASAPAIGTVTASAGATQVTLAGGQIPAASASGTNGQCTVDIEVTSTTPNSTGTARIEIGDLDGLSNGAPVSNSSPASQTITVQKLNAATLEKTFSVSTVTVGNPFRMTLVIGNKANSRPLALNDSTDTTPYALRDTLPAGMAVAPVPNVSTSCSAGGVVPPVVVAAAGTNVVQIEGGQIADGGTCTVAVDLVTTTTGGAYESPSITNSISGTADFHNRRGLSANNASDSLKSTAMLRVGKSFVLGAIGEGQESELTITLTNASASQTLTTAQAFRDDPLDQYGVAGYGLKVAASGPTTTCNTTVTSVSGGAGVELAAGATLAPGASCKITVPFIGTLQTVGTPQSFINTIAEGTVKLTDASVISQPATATVVVVDQLTVSKSIFPDGGKVAAGNPVRFTVTVNNFSAGALTNVAIADVLPTGMIFLTAPNAPAAPTYTGSACTGTLGVNSATAGRVTFTIPNMAAGSGEAPSTCKVIFYAQTPAGAAPAEVHANSIDAGGVTATGPGGPITNHSPSTPADADFTIDSVITVNKAFSPASAAEGVVSQLTVQFTNLSAKPVTGASFTDNLPVGSTGGQLMVANPNLATTTCVGGVVSAEPGANVVSMTGATIPARAGNGSGAAGSCSLTVSVIGGAGNYINSLPAGALTGTETLGDSSTRTATSPGPVNASLTYSSALTAAKSFAPNTISSGGVSTVTVTLGNTAGGTLNNVSVRDPLPPGMTLAPTPNAATTCASGAVTAVAGAGTISMTGAVIPSGVQCTLKFDVTATGASGWTNTIPVGDITADGGVRNTTPITAALANSSAGGVIVTNAMSVPSLTSPGQFSVLTVTITNNGSVDLSNLNLTDYFTVDGLVGGAQTGMIVAITPNALTTCTNGFVAATANGTSLGLSGATLPAGGSCTFSVNVTLNTTGTVQNTIPVGAIANDQGVSNTLPTQTSLSVGSNLGITKVFTPAVIRPNEISRLRIQLINPSASPAASLKVTDTLPAGVVLAAEPNAYTTCSAATITAVGGGTSVGLSGGSLAGASAGASTSCYVEVDVTSAAAGAYDNIIAAGDLTGTVGGTPASNSGPATATLEVRTPLTLAKAFNPTIVDMSVPTTVTLTVTNSNILPLTGATLRDDLPEGLTVALTPNASTTCVGGSVNAVVSATYVTLTGATLPANGACTVTFDAVSNVAGAYVNTIPAGNISTNQGVTNEAPATDTVRVTNRPTVSKQFSPIGIPANGQSTLTIVLGNTNATAATLSADLVDTLPTSPAPIVVATPNGLTNSCLGTPATATAAAADVTVPAGAIIPPGGCSITVNVTGATEGTYTNYIATNALQTNFGNNAQPANANLVISKLGFISGRVFKDTDVSPDGLFNGTDAGIAGVTITLTGTDYGADGVAGGGDDAAVNRTTVTDALGNYAFTGLNPGAYVVTEPGQPAGTLNGIVSSGPVNGGGGGTPGTGANPTTTSSTISGVTLLKNGANHVDSSPDNNFAEVALSSIAGSIYLDQNDNGVRNAADSALQGVTVQLLNDLGVVVATTTTGSNGGYKFSDLKPGTYSVLEPVQPAGTANGKTLAGTVGNGGSAGTPTAQNIAPSAIAGIVLPPGTASIGNDFAEVPAGRQVSGRVFADANNDGVFNTGADRPLAGVQVVLTGVDFNGIAVGPTTAVTDSEGRYSFTGLAAGTYIVSEPNQPPNTTNGITTPGTTGGVATDVTVTPSVISVIDLTGGKSISQNNDFAEIPVAPSAGVISGTVYVDANDNGLVDGGEPGIGGVSMSLTGLDADGNRVNLTTVTDANGAYTFTGVPPSGAGGYTISETQPATHSDGKTSPGPSGSAAATKPVATGERDTITGVTLASGESSPNHNFGERPSGATISGYVFVDTDNDGVRDPGEAAIPGVTVQLTGVDANGGAVSIVQTTGEDGAFNFVNVPASNSAGYTISEVQPAGFTDGKSGVQAGNPGSAVTGKPVGVGDMDQITGVVTQGAATLTDYRFGEIAVPLLKPPIINGYVYLDRDHDRVRPRDGSTDGQPGWTVVLRQNGVAICTVTTDAKGFYQFDNLHCAGYEQSGLPTGPGFSITFTKDGGSLPAVPTSGDDRGQVPSTGGQILDITLNASDRVTEQNLPLDPAGVVYDSVTRKPIPGATVVITGPGGFDSAQHLVGGTAAQTQVTGADGYYGFLLQNDFPSGVYTLTVTSPVGYLPGPSGQLPPCVNTLNVTLFPDPALIQRSDYAPGQSVPIHNPAACSGQVAGGSTTTQYYLTLNITRGGSAPILNNHIPLDPMAAGAILVTKTTPKLWVSRGDLVPYTITATNTSDKVLENISVRDQLPPGFKYREGSATRDRAPVTPSVDGGFIAWPAESFAPNQKRTYSLMLTVGAGVGDGDYTNRAWAGLAPGGSQISNLATAQVRIAPDPTLDCPDIIGQVFDDRNANGYQDEGEPGIPGVRMATPNGLLVTSDAEGRFHVPCPVTPNMDRGSNFVMKLDVRSLPSGYRVTTENPRDVRVTRGKMTKLNFGATIHRVVRVELTSEAFEPGKTELKPDWRAKIEAIQEPLRERPSIVRIAYGPGDDPPGLVRRRTQEVRDLIQRGWKAHKRQYALVIEIEGER